VRSTLVKKEIPRMTRRKLIDVLALIAVLAIPALAGPSKATLRLSIPVTLAGTALDAGEYEVTATEAKVTVRLAGRQKVLLEKEANWVDAPEKTDHNTCIIQNGVIKEIRFAGKKRFLSFQ
jgi:hypothetical protein